MARPASSHPTDGELEILQVLWDLGPSSLGTICERLRQQRDVATTTVATVLKVMLQKSLVRRSQGERGYLWTAAITRRKTATGMVGKIVDRIFDGSAQRLVTHLLESGQLNARELEELRALLENTSTKKTPGNKRRKS